MEIYFDKDLNGKIISRIFFMRHGDHDPIDWECKLIKGINQDTFRDLNKFWAFLPSETQDRIFEIFLEIRQTFNNVFELNTAYTLINASVQELYKLHPISLFDHWVRVHSDIRYPDNLKDELLEDDRPEQTYLQSDYQDLTVLSVALKIMVPIWGEYLSLDTGMSEMNREIYAVQLLRRTEIHDSKIIGRFKEFVDFIVGGQQTGMQNILFGIGSLQMPEYVRANLLVMRLSIAPLSHRDDEDMETTVNLVANLWRNVKVLLADTGGRGVDAVKSKNMPNDTAGDEDNLSTAESYKARESISDGERIAFDFAGLQMRRSFFTRILGANADIGLLERQYKRNLSRKYFNLTEEQLKLTELVVSRLFPTRALVHTDRQSAVIAISVAQVALHQRGFSVLADLLGANRGSETHSIVSSGAIKKDQLDILDEIYSFRRPVYQKNSRTKTFLMNPGAIAVEALYTAFSLYHWQRDIDNEIAQASTMVETGNTFVVPANFKVLLADFMINLHEENKAI